MTENESRIVKAAFPSNPMNTYVNELLLFLRKPNEHYILGALGILRCMVEVTDNCLDQFIRLNSAKKTELTAGDNNIVESIIKYRKQLCTERSENIRGEISRPLHYQGYRGGDFSSEKTSQLMKNPLAYVLDETGKEKYSSLGSLFVLQLNRYLTIITSLKAYFDESFDDIHIQEILDYVNEAKEINSYASKSIEKINSFKYTTILNTSQNGLYCQLDSLGRIIQNVDRATPKGLNCIQYLSLAIACRTIAEMAGHFFSWENRVLAEKKRINDGKKQKGEETQIGDLLLSHEIENKVLTLDDYRGYLATHKSVMDSWLEKNELTDTIATIDIIRDICNGLLDEVDDKTKNIRGVSRFPTENSAKKEVGRIITAAASLSNALITAPLPASIKYLNDQYRGEVKKLRNKLRHQRVGRILSLPFASIGILLLFSIVFYNIPQEKFYADYIWIGGQPRGIFEISKQEAETQNHYRFTIEHRIPFISQGVITRVRHENASGKLINETLDIYQDRAAEIILPPSSGFQIDGFQNLAIFYDEDQNTLYRAETSFDLSSISFSHPDTGLEMPLPFSVVDLDVYSWANQSAENIYQKTVSEMSFERTLRLDNGLISSISFRRDDHYYTDGNGVSSIDYTYDEYSRIIAIDYHYDVRQISSGQDSAVLLPGQAVQENSLQGDRIIRREFTYLDEKLISCLDRFANDKYVQRSYSYDKHGNCISELYFNELDSEKAYLKHLWSYDENGKHIISSCYLNLDQQYIIGPEGYAISKYFYENDLLVRQERYSIDEKLLPPEEGWAVYACDYRSENNKDYRIAYYLDNQGGLMSRVGNPNYIYDIEIIEGNTTITACEDINRQVIPRAEGYYFTKRTKEDGGTRIIIEYLDSDGSLYMTQYGYARIVSTYKGSLLETTKYYDDNLMPINVNGACTITRKYNAKRQIAELSYESVTLMFSNGYNREKSEYDANNGRILYSTFYYNDNPVISKNEGYATVAYEYYDDENCIAWFYYDDSGRKMINEYRGYSGIKQIYAEDGSIIEEIYLNVNGENIKTESNGYKRIFDKENNIVFCQVALPQDNESGVIYQRNLYDQEDRLIETAWMNEKMELIIHPNYGYATKKYDRQSTDSGSLLTTSCYDLDGQLIENNAWGAYYLVEEYNNKNQRIKVRYYSKNKELIIATALGYAGFNEQYDERGRSISWEYVDNTDTVTIVKEVGYAAIRQEYDFHDNVILEEYLDAQGKRMNSLNEGYAEIKWLYDIRGNLLSLSYIDVNGNLFMNSKAGYALGEWAYNARNEWIEETYYDEYGQKMVRVDGNSVSEGLTLSEGFTTIKKMSGASMIVSGNGEFVFSSENYDVASIFPADLFSHDVIWDDRLYSEFYDFDNNVVMGYAIDVVAPPNSHTDDYAYFYDMMDQIYPFISDCEYNIMVCIFDKDGNRISDTWVKETENGFLRGYNEIFGYATCERTYDDKGNLISVCYRDEKGLFIVPQLGDHFAVSLTEFNEKNHIVSRSYFGEDGQLMMNSHTGYSYCTIEYDQQERIKNISYWDAEDRCIKIVVDDIADVESITSFYGNETIISPGNHRVLKNNDRQGYASFKFDYSNDGAVIIKTVFDENEKIIMQFRESGLENIDIPINNQIMGYIENDIISVQVVDLYEGNNNISTRVAKFKGKGNALLGITTQSMLNDDNTIPEMIIINHSDGLTPSGVMLIDSSGKTDDPPNGWYCLVDEKMGINDRVFERTYLKKNKTGQVEYIVIEYDQNGNVTSYSFYNEEWQPIIDDDTGCFTVCQIFDLQNQLIGKYYLYVDETYMKNRNTNSAATYYSKNDSITKVMEYDESGRIINESEIENATANSLDDILLHLVENCVVIAKEEQ